MRQDAPNPFPDSIAAIKEQIAPYLGLHVSTAMLAARLGREMEPPGGGVLTFQPLDTRFKEARLYLDEGPGGSEAPYMLELTPAASPALNVADMDKAFGKSRRGSPPPEGNPFILRYDYAPVNLPYEAELTVDLTRSPDDPQARVRRIRIMRFPHRHADKEPGR